MDASPVAMTLADVLPASSRAPSTRRDHHRLHHDAIPDAAKYVVERPARPELDHRHEQEMARSLPPTQKIVAMMPEDLAGRRSVREGVLRQATQGVTDRGGELISLPAAEQSAMIDKISSIGEDLSKTKPELNKAVKTVFESAKRNK
jgi:hypothetical protein